MSIETLFFGEANGKPQGGLVSGMYPCLVLLDADGETVFKAPPDGDSGQGDGPDWEKVFGF